MFKFNTIFIFLVILIACFISCTNKRSDLLRSPELIEIDIDVKERPKLDITIEAIIPLETSPNSLLSNIDKVKYFNKRFYLLNNNRFQQPALFVFDDKGKFVRKTIQGKGPGEVIEPFAFAINREDATIFLHDQTSGSTRVYDRDLNYIKSIDHEYRFISDFYHINRDTFLIYHHQDNPDYKAGKQYFSHTLYTEGFSKEKHLGIVSNNRMTMPNPVSIFKNEVLMLDSWNYTIYQLIHGEKRIRYLLDLGKYGFTKKESQEFSGDEIDDNIAQGKRAGVAGIFKTNDFLVVMTAIKDNALTYFRSLKNKKIYCYNDWAYANLMEYSLIQGVTDDGLFYGLVEPAQLIQFQNTSGRFKELKVNENDNPYLLLFKVKEPK
jgi:hypothetical protein